LKKHGYRRSHNYRVLNELVKNEVLVKEENGVYRLKKEILSAAERASRFVGRADNILESKNASVVPSMEQ
jgi:hypothetical protein